MLADSSDHASVYAKTLQVSVTVSAIAQSSKSIKDDRRRIATSTMVTGTEPAVRPRCVMPIHYSMHTVHVRVDGQLQVTMIWARWKQLLCCSLAPARTSQAFHMPALTVQAKDGEQNRGRSGLQRPLTADTLRSARSSTGPRAGNRQRTPFEES